MPVIATNTSANTALTYLNRNSEDQAKSLSKLSSGSRIVVASDDAAGLAVASRLQADITTLNQAARNALQGRAVVQVADGALSRIGDMLQRMKSLAAQSLSGSVDNASRGFINQEYQQLVSEIDAIVADAEFNGNVLLDGTFNQSFLVGVDSGDTIAVDWATAGTDQINAASSNLGDLNGSGTVKLNATAVDAIGGGAGSAEEALDAVDDAIDSISSFRSTVGSFISRFEYRGEYIQTAIENLSAAKSSIMDVDIAAEQSNLVSKQVLTEASIAALAQANQSKSSLLALLR
ncbi:MAG: flagellin [Micavibrio sp.]|jgi:flagellin|nr:flagellin [Micavibrio sp.]